MKDIQELFRQYDFNFDDSTVRAEVAKIVADNFEPNNNIDVWKKCFSLIDLTSLNHTDTEAEIEQMMKKVNDFKNHFPDMPEVPAVCVYPSLVPITRQTLSGATKIAAVSACFPASQTFIEAKVAEVALTANAGADEIDIVISVGKFLEGKYEEVLEEIEELKSACRESHLKAILETGSLKSAENIKKASLIAIAAGADFIKTSTGKTSPAATPEAAYIMCQVIKEYYAKTGIKIGFKPAGGVSTTEEAVAYYSIVKAILGEEWLNSDLFRFGASRLANNLLSSIEGKEVKYY